MHRDLLFYPWASCAHVFHKVAFLQHSYILNIEKSCQLVGCTKFIVMKFEEIYFGPVVV